MSGTVLIVGNENKKEDGLVAPSNQYPILGAVFREMNLLGVSEMMERDWES